MAIPSIVQATDTFNTWLDATNNVITELSNSSSYILLAANATPIVATGNAAMSGTLTVSTLVVNSSANIAGTTATFNANVIANGTNFDVAANVSLTGATLSVGGSETITGSFLNVVTGTFRVGGNANVVGVLTTSANTLFNGNTTANNLVVSGNTTLTGAATLSNTLAVTGTALFNNTITLNSTTVVKGSFTANGLVDLGGPLFYGATFVTNDLALSGAGPYNDLSSGVTGIANSTVHKIAIDQAAVVTGLSTANADVHRQIILFNSGNFDITLAHANTGSLANNRFLCPSNTSFVLQKQSAVALYYDANTSVRSWRVVGSTIPYNNASSLNTGTVSYSVLPATLVNTSSGVANAATFLTGNLVTTNSTFLSVANSTFSALVNPGQFFTGNNTDFFFTTYAAISLKNSSSNIYCTPASILIRDASGNAAINSTTIVIANSTTSSTLTANTFSGTAANATNLNSQPGSYYLNATNINAGTLGAARYVSANSSANGAVDTTTQSFAGAKTFLGNTTFSNKIVVTGIFENWNVISGPANSSVDVVVDVLTSPVLFYGNQATASWKTNIRGNSTVSFADTLSTYQAMTVVFLTPQGTTTYPANTTASDGFKIDGVNTSVRWMSTPSSASTTAGAVDAYTYTILKNGANSYVVLASQTRYIT